MVYLATGINMADDISDFLNQTKVDVEAAQYLAANAFNRVWIVPAVNLEMLLQIPRWPVALINDAGGELDPVNGKVWTRSMDITIIDAQPRDHVAEKTTLEVLNRGEVLVAALEYNRRDGIYLVADSDVQAFATATGLIMVQKTYTFAYQIQRA